MMNDRKATTEDCKAVYELICDMENTQLDYERFESIFRQQLSDGRYYCLVREEGGCVIAILNLRFENQLHHADRIAEIMEFAVHPAWRDRGIGSELLLKAAELAEAAGCCRIEVACNRLRTDTHRFYLKNGLHNFHFKFSKGLSEEDTEENRLGR